VSVTRGCVVVDGRGTQGRAVMFEIWRGRECHQLGSFIALSAYESIITVVGCRNLRGCDVDDEGNDGGIDAPVSTWARDARHPYVDVDPDVRFSYVDVVGMRSTRRRARSLNLLQ
jgi:hypothetical protein